MSRKIKFYLSHPFLDRLKGLEIQRELESKLGIKIHNPFYNGWEQEWIKDYDRGIIDDEEFNRFLKKYARKIVFSDFENIDRCDGLIALQTRVSWGVGYETMYAYLRNKPIFIFQPELIYNLYKIHPWNIVLAKCYRTKAGLIRGLKSYLKRITKYDASV